MTFRAGTFGTVNAVIGLIFTAAFAALVLVAWASAAHGDSVGWSILGGIIALSACFVMIGMTCRGVSTWRPVVLSTTTLSLPAFTFRRGFYREEIALPDIEDVALTYRSEPRSGRWQLVVTRRDGGPMPCDSITSSRSRTAATADTAAARAVGRLRSAVQEACA